MDDLIIVAILDAHFGESSARKDFEIALDRDAKGIKAEQVDHPRHARTLRHSTVLAIHTD
jgi:hypothetical protein